MPFSKNIGSFNGKAVGSQAGKIFSSELLIPFNAVIIPTRAIIPKTITKMVSIERTQFAMIYRNAILKFSNRKNCLIGQKTLWDQS